MKKGGIFKILAVFPAFFCVSCFQTSTKTNAEEYEEILKDARDNSDFHSELYIFPESIEGTEIKHFVYAEMTDMFTGSYLMYVVLTYQPEDFSAELERIASVKATFKSGLEKHVIYYPEQKAYLSIQQENRYEYVIFNETTSEIAYVSNQLFQWKDTPVESQYILPQLTIPEELEDKGWGYNIYYEYDGDVGLYIED